MNTTPCMTDADLFKLFSGEATAEEKSSSETHLAQCADCRHRWEDLLLSGETMTEILTEAHVRSGGSPCLSDREAAGYLTDSLSPKDRLAVEAHLRLCPECTQRLQDVDDAVGDLEQADDDEWSRDVADALFGFMERFPETVDTFRSALASKPCEASGTEPLSLPLVLPKNQQATRLAAATGDGFHRQTLRQNDPPAEFQVVQFGRQLRITVHILDEQSLVNTCLAWLEFMEGSTRRFRQLVQVKDGRAYCVVQPEQTADLAPLEESLTLRLTPLISRQDLTDAGTDVYVPILMNLMKHPDPQIRRGAMGVIATVLGSGARPLIEPLTRDDDRDVRELAGKMIALYRGR